MQSDKAHPAGVDALADPLDKRVVHFAVRHVAPPDEDVGRVQHRVRQALIRVVEGGERHVDVAAFGERLADDGVDAVRIDLADPLLGLFVAEFIPDGDAQFFLFHGLFSVLPRGRRSIRFSVSHYSTDGRGVSSDAASACVRRASRV